MQDVLNRLAQAIADATSLPLDKVRPALGKPKGKGHGDVAYPCFELAKLWGQAPPLCASRLQESLALPEGIASAAVAGGYLNFSFDRAAVARQGLAPHGPLPNKPVGPVLLEYSSPNIAKPFHVGHLRTTMIGHALSRALVEGGYDVVSINHLGDWGTQFGFVHAGVELWGRPEEETVDALVETYRRATGLRKAQDAGTVPAEDAGKPDVNAMARAYFLRLEAGDPEARAFWQWNLDVSLAYLRGAYDRLGIAFDHYTGESFFESRLPAVRKMLEESGIMKEDQGAWGVDLGEELGFARVYTEDGRSLYLTRDLAAAVYRYEEFNPSRILYIVSNQQTLHFRQLKAILERLGHPVAPLIHHVPFGYVPGMSTRGGDNVSLSAFLAEAVERATTAYAGVRREEDQVGDVEAIAEAVAVGASFFYFLDHSNNKDFHFSWDEALSFQGDTGPYVQYAVARINSVEDKARAAGIEAAAEPDLSLLTDDAAFEMLTLLTEMDAKIAETCEDYEPVHLTTHLLALARAFMKGYAGLRVIGTEEATAAARLALFRAVRAGLERGMGLVGVPVVRRM